jgi:hypothetical protein
MAPMRGVPFADMLLAWAGPGLAPEGVRCGAMQNWIALTGVPIATRDPAGISEMSMVWASLGSAPSVLLALLVGRYTGSIIESSADEGSESALRPCTGSDARRARTASFSPRAASCSTSSGARAWSAPP